MNIQEDRDYQLVERKYGRIARMLALLWGSDMFKEYVNNILNDTRDGTRQGFPKNVAEALTGLLISHDRLYPQFNKPSDPTAGWFTYGR
jgi:hypothetical protein